jgi:small subunit ribosomal protein S17
MEKVKKSADKAGKKIIIRKQGMVVSDKMQKTLVVAVQNFKTHPKYHKKFIYTKKYKVHDLEGKYKVGDKVEIVPCRPVSKDKRYRVV